MSFKHAYKNNEYVLSMVAQACNLSYLGGREEDCGASPVPAKI
jgi:hypothetical protein